MATDIANSYSYLIIPNFDKNKAMLETLRAKFNQYDDLKKILLSTCDKRLIEHNIYDDYWSDGGDGSGQNMFGILLMQVRKELSNNSIFN